MLAQTPLDFSQNRTKIISRMETILRSAREFIDLKTKCQTPRQRYDDLFQEYEIAKAQGFKLKTWICEKDGHTRPVHQAMDGKQVYIDSNFNVAGIEMFLPSDPKAPPSHISCCRCRVAYSNQGVNPSREEILAEIKKLSNSYEIPVRALAAVVAIESAFIQFRQDGSPNGNTRSSAIGLGQLTRLLLGISGHDRARWDWKYNLEQCAAYFHECYFLPVNDGIGDPRIRAARAYGLYHDGKNASWYREHRGIDSRAYIKSYLSWYDRFG